MGQGQEMVARAAIRTGLADGGWVLIQNAHLSIAFLHEINDILKRAADAEADGGPAAHPDFRLWLTAEPTPAFPIALLQSSLTVTYEAPQGLKAGLTATFSWMSQDMVDAVDSPQWPPIIFSVSFLHSLLQERRRFGALGWNIPYEFNLSDLTASLQYIQNYMFRCASYE